VLVLSIVFLSFTVAGTLLEIFQTTPENTKGKQDTHGMRLADDCGDNRTRSDASVLVLTIVFLSFIVVSMLVEVFHTIPVNAKEKTRHAWYAARRRLLRQSDKV
jgi:hypothetical protein